MGSAFHDIDPAGMAIAPDGSPVYSDRRLVKAVVEGCGDTGMHPNRPNQACPNPASCGTNWINCTNDANCTGKDNEFICKNRGNCDPSSNAPQCTDTYCKCRP
jgi:hypothetical protein